MDNSIYGIDIIRAYELSWLAENGKPQLGILEISQNILEPEIDTWKFKVFLEGINNKRYPNMLAVKNSICEFLNIDANFINLVSHDKFKTLKFFEEIQLPDTTNLLAKDLRFICHKSGQPYIGKVNLLTDKLKVNESLVDSIITSLRNKKFTPQTLVQELFAKLQALTQQNFTLSLHLNRRGGISYQALRSNYETDFSVLNHRSILE